MRRKSSLWKTTAVSLSAMMTLSMGAAVLAAGTEQTTHESQTEDNTENKSADTDEASNTAETKTEECKIELSDNGILVDGEAISENPRILFMLEQTLFIIKKDRTALMVPVMRMMVILRKRQLRIQLSQSQRQEHIV